MSARLLVVAAVCGLISACARCADPAPVPGPVEAPAATKNVKRAIHRPEGKPLASVVNPTAKYELALYWLGAPPKKAIDELKALAKKDAPALAVMEQLSAAPTTAEVHFSEPAITDYAPPSAEHLAYFGRGLSDGEKQQLGACTGVTKLQISTDAAHAVAALRAVHVLADKASRKHPSLVWDETTRELFSPEAFSALRLTPWRHALPTASSQIIIHAYQSEGVGLRLVTLGMQKLALPDIAVEHVPSGFARQVELLINAMAQHFLETPERIKAGVLHVGAAELSDETIAKRLLAVQHSNAVGAVDVLVLETKPREGDAANRLVQPDFPGDGLLEERMATALVALFGEGEDPSVPVPASDEALKAASAKARARLPEVEARFKVRASSLEQLSIKAPFEGADGVEYMWVDVQRWADGGVEGVLLNEPDAIPTLHLGARVVVRDRDIYDWSIHLRDGGTDGEETEAVLRERR